MPKKKLMNNMRTDARSERISQLHRQSKSNSSSEHSVQSNENGRPSKCKLRDVKNNKKKSDKKELSRLLFARVVPERPRREQPASNLEQDDAVCYTNDALSQASTSFEEPPSPLLAPQVQVQSSPPIQVQVQPPGNSNTADSSANNHTQPSNNVPESSITGEATTESAFNYPLIFGENLNRDTRIPLNYLDYFNSPSGTTYIKYVLNPVYAQPVTSLKKIFGYTSEDDECKNVMTALCKHVYEQEEYEAMNGHAQASDLFSIEQFKILKYIRNQFLKLTATSVYLNATRENLQHVIQNTEDTDPHKIVKVEEAKTKEQEIIALEVDVRKELNNYIRTNLPDDLKMKLLAIANSQGTQTDDDDDARTSTSTSQEPQSNISNRIRHLNTSSQNRLTRKQKKNKKKMAKKVRFSKILSNNVQYEGNLNSTFNSSDSNMNGTLEANRGGPVDNTNENEENFSSGQSNDDIAPGSSRNVSSGLPRIGVSSGPSRIDVAPGPSRIDASSGASHNNVYTGTSYSYAYPGTTYNNVYPGTYHNYVFPGTYHNNFLPRTYHNNVFPGTSHNNVFPGTSHNNVFPGTSHNNIFRGTSYAIDSWDTSHNDVSSGTSQNDTRKLNIVQQFFGNYNAIVPTNLTPFNLQSYLINYLERNNNVNLKNDEISFLVQVINNRVRLNDGQPENYIKHYFTYDNHNMVFKRPAINTIENRNKTVVDFIQKNFPFIKNDEFNGEDSGSEDMDEMENDENGSTSSMNGSFTDPIPEGDPQL